LRTWKLFLRHASARKCNQKASGASIECHELHS
jgi:hypothetical protein